MAIALNTPRGEGHTACLKGKPHTSSPYHTIDNLMQWMEWQEGWFEAYNAGLYGSAFEWRKNIFGDEK